MFGKRLGTALAGAQEVAAAIMLWILTSACTAAPLLSRVCSRAGPTWGVLPPGEGDLTQGAPANPSLLAWQCEDNSGQKYLCGWRKVNFSASVFFPGNCGHCQIQQNRSRNRVRQGPCRASEGALPPCSCLLPAAICLQGGAEGGGGA